VTPQHRAGRAAAPPRPDAARSAVRWAGWLVALALLTAAMLAARPRLDKAHVALAYLLVVLGASAGGGRALGFTVAGAAFVAFNFLFLPPYHTLTIAEPLDWLVLVAFLAASAVATQLLYRATSTAETATRRAEELDRLAALGAETLSAPGAEQALAAIVAVIRETTDVDGCEVYRHDGSVAVVRVAASTRGIDPTAPDAPAPDAPSEWRGAAAGQAGPGSLLRWAADRGLSAVELSDGTIRVTPEPEDGGRPDHRAAGGGSESLLELAHPGLSSLTGAVTGRRLTGLRYAIRRADSESRSHGGRVAAPDARRSPEGPTVRTLLLPLVVREQSVGVLRLTSGGGVALTPEQARLLVALAYYAALGVERVRLVETAERAEAERRVEALRGALLTAVSHDLRTPLTTIKGIAHEVAHGADPARAAVIEAEADRLNDLVSDLLDLSRIHAGAVRPAVSVNTVDDLVGAALQRAAGALGDRPVATHLPDDVLAGRFDFTQALRVLVNLLENAAKYAPAGTPLELHARGAGDRLSLTVLDRGPGVPAAEHERIFEPFYRPPGTPPDVRGTGLGLSIARGLAEAQGGTVRYEPRPGGGSAFVLELPAAGPLPLDDAVPAPH